MTSHNMSSFAPGTIQMFFSFMKPIDVSAAPQDRTQY